MKYKIEKQDRVQYVTVIWDDLTGATFDFVDDRDETTMLKDAYILSANPANRRLKFEAIPEDFITFEPNSTPTILKVLNWFDLQARVYDQYGQEMETEVTFTIEGENARIENGKIVEDAVTEDTSFFIVAKVGELEQRQERYLYAPVKPPVSEMEILETKLKASTNRQDFLEELIAEMAMMLYE